ncbi:synaptic vesicle glycoprotein 2B-like isoform X1 [Diorhabda sublineata]|uniref:synaptic vesicle glycoprotein 2B-like isoform X1 n=1 Tax=Diorhabda sublineata TaxID=1163346 RepID=UPI0024E0DE11|nr:synaptic vesicle glycoprotein 2B-like isoform X1 [Diorhabda sublineata]XP_056644326.1 synaptic vesicle glycoprotein 2B-like isoform X1 [Diorhabda sublineata]
MNVPKFCRDNKESCSFDEAITLTGYGKFQYEAAAICCLSIVIVGFQNDISSYIFPSAKCELNLTSFELGLLNVAFLGGGTISCFLWGLLADNKGRKKVIIFTHFCNALVTIMSALNTHTTFLVVCRFINGFLTGAPGSLTYAYLAEFQPPKYRFRSVCFLGLFFIGSWLLLPIIAYVILPLNINYSFKDIIKLSPWRFFLLLIALPEIVVTFWFTRLPESPKYHTGRGNPKEALKILHKMYFINTGNSPDCFPVKYIICEGDSHRRHNTIVSRGKMYRVLKEVGDHLKQLFQKPLLWRTFLISSIMFSNMFGLFGLGLWLPELFIKFERYQTLYPNTTASIELLSNLPLDGENSSETSFDTSVIMSTVATGTAALIFNAVSCLLSTRISSKTMTSALSLAAGVSAGAIYWLTSSTQNLVVACIFQATMLTANMCITSLIVELFPSTVGGIAVCTVICAGRIGAAISNLVFAYLVDKRCELPIFIVAAVEIVCGILCFFVPKPGDCLNDEKEEKNAEKFTRVSIW